MTAVALDRVEPVVTHVGDVPMSGFVVTVPEPRSTLVAIHGYAARSRYFHGDAHPDLSLLTVAALLGHNVVALDRPGYGASAGHTDHMSQPDRVALYCRAIEQVLADTEPAPRMVVSHSLGACTAARLVTGALPDVVGWELCANALRHYPMDLPPADRPGAAAAVRDSVWGPSDLYPAGRRDTGVRKGDSMAVTEGPDATNWRQEYTEFAARVAVPVRLTIGDNDRLWEHTPAYMAELAAHFTASPRVITTVQPEAPHNVSLSRFARAYHLGVLAFTEECLLASGAR